MFQTCMRFWCDSGANSQIQRPLLCYWTPRTPFCPDWWSRSWIPWWSWWESAPTFSSCTHQDWSQMQNTRCNHNWYFWVHWTVLKCFGVSCHRCASLVSWMQLCFVGWSFESGSFKTWLRWSFKTSRLESKVLTNWYWNGISIIPVGAGLLF